MKDIAFCILLCPGIARGLFIMRSASTPHFSVSYNQIPPRAIARIAQGLAGQSGEYLLPLKCCCLLFFVNFGKIDGLLLQLFTNSWIQIKRSWLT